MFEITIHFKLDPDSSSSGTLFYQIQGFEKTHRIMTDYRVESDEWDDENQTVHLSGSIRDNYLREVMQKLYNELSELHYIMGELKQSDGDFSGYSVESRFNKSQKSKTFIAFMDKLILSMHENRQFGTAKNYQRARKSFTSFCQKESISFEEISGDLINQYERWLKNKNVSKNTVSFYMRNLRSVYNKAVECQYIEQTFPFKKAYTGVDRTTNRAMDESLIVSLKNLNLSRNRSLASARDLFLFSFYSRGMAFVDMAFLKKSHIKNNVLYYSRHKTSQSMSVRLEPCIIEIINRYSVLTKSSDYLLPIITEVDDQKAYKQYLNKLSYYNKLLKQIADMLNLNTQLTSYVARHTWATVARNRNIPISVISAGMGHSSESITKIYLASLEASVIDDANKMIINAISSSSW
jgi:site-specific recombinase XerD